MWSKNAESLHYVHQVDNARKLYFVIMHDHIQHAIWNGILYIISYNTTAISSTLDLQHYLAGLATTLQANLAITPGFTWLANALIKIWVNHIMIQILFLIRKHK